MNPFPPSARVFAYLRDSGHEHQEESVTQQEKEIRAWCLRQGVILQKVYVDEARVGSDDEKREQLQEMMNVLRHGADVDGVIVWSSSRFARNATHAQFYRSEIRKLGYTYHSMTDKTTDGPEALIFEALIDYKNQQFLEDLSIEVKRGLRDLVERHGCVPGVPPRGFQRQKVTVGTRRDGKERTAHRWVIDPESAPRVRQAFEMRAAGASLAQIQAATRLYGSLNSYVSFWPNKLYIGTLEYGGRVYENYCQPIVPLETWQRVQEIQKHYAGHHHVSAKSRLHPRRVASKYLLSGLAHCARCGSPLFGRSSKRKNGPAYQSYFCTRAYRQRDCSKQRIPAKTFETAVIDALQNTYLDPDYLYALGTEFASKNAGLEEQLEEERRTLTAELGTLLRQITHVTDAIAASGHSPSLLQRLSQLESDETGLRTRLSANDAARQAAILPKLGLDQLRERVQRLRTALASGDLPTRRAILAGLIHSIHVDREGKRLFGTISVYYPPEDNIPPTGPPGGGDVMPIYRGPSGPPRYRHNLQFEAPTRYKSRSS